jgi:hypothetical protein
MRSIGILLSFLSGMAVSCSEAKFVSGIERASSKMKLTQEEELMLKDSEDKAREKLVITEDTALELGEEAGVEVESESICLDGKRGFVDFENLPGAAQGKTIDDELNKYFDEKFHVKFRYVGGAQMKLAKIFDESDPNISFESWWSVLCPGKKINRQPKRNRICGAGKAEAGRWALSTSNALTSKSIQFEVLYSRLATNPSFVLYDFDGREKWTIQAFAEDGKVVATKSLDARKGYSVKRTDNSGGITVVIDTAGKKINRLLLTGSKNIKIFGFGFDNFSTGVCQKK